MECNEPVLLRENHGPVAVLTLNRPQARNSLTQALLHELHDAVLDLASDSRIRVMILTGAGPAFCAGHDLRELQARRSDADGGRAFFEAVFSLCGDTMQAISLSPKPVIAAVNGIATAAGCQLVAACDLAIASNEAQFCTPGVNIGLFCSTPMVPLSRTVSRKHALEMLLTGDMTGAARAVETGLINATCPPEDLPGAAMSLANHIASKSPQAITMGKKIFHAQFDLPMAEAYRQTTQVMVENMLVADACEGIGAFLEKRPPRWPSA